MQTCSDQLKYNRHWVCEQNSCADDERLKYESSRYRKITVWEKCAKDQQSKVSAAVVAETQDRERNTELTVRLASKKARGTQITDAQTCVITFSHGFRTGVRAIVMRLGDVMNLLRLDLFTLARDGLRSACEEVISIAVVDFTAAVR